MVQKVRLVFGIAGIAALIALAFYAHNYLSGRVGEEAITELIEEQAAVVREEDPEEKLPAPDFEMTDLEGATLRLSDLMGRPIVLTFWASWCSSCNAQNPVFEEAYSQLGGEVQFVMLNLTDPFREPKETAIRYVEENGYTFPVFFDDFNQAGATAYGIRFIPTTVFIDSEGNVRAISQSAMNESALMRGIELITIDN